MKKLIGLVFAAVLATGCIPPNGTYGSYQMTVTGSTGVYINGLELGTNDKQQLDAFLGVQLPPGRYYVDQNGMMGIEGQRPQVNLVAIANARGGGNANRGNGGGNSDVVINSRGGVGNGSFVSNGKCAIVSTPHGSITSGKC
jgi:hypothetical protein